MFNLKKKHQELTTLSDDLLDIKYELMQAKRYYLTHPEDHIPAFTDKSAAPMYLQQVEDLIAKVEDRFWDVRFEASKRKYKIFNRK